MFTQPVNYQNFYLHNYNFNKSYPVVTLINELFQTKNVGKIGYLMSTPRNFQNGRHTNILKTEINTNDLENKKEILSLDEVEIQKESIIDCDILGIEEKALFSFITNLTYNHIVITGALGSGKTALIKYLFEHLKENGHTEVCEELNCCEHKSPSQIYIDFNVQYPSANKDEVMRLFREDLLNKLSKKVIQLLQREQIFDEVIKGIRNYEDSKYFDAYKFFEEKVLDTNDWEKLTYIKKCKKITNWVDETRGEHQLPFKLSAMFSLLSYIVNILEPIRNECFIIAYDNIDKFDDEVQDELLDVIMSFSNGIKIKHLVAVRLTAFGQIVGNGSISYAVFEHGGYPVSQLVGHRIQHYLENKQEYSEITKDIEPQYLLIVNNRLEFIKTELLDHKSLLSKVLCCFSGVSVRRGLFLSERFFINSSIGYEEIRENYNYFVRALTVGESPECKLSFEDALVSNIFYIPHSRRNSLLIFKILTVLKNARKNGLGISANELFIIMKNSVLLTDEDFLSSLNYLVYVKKRLIYVNGISRFENIEQIINCDQRVSITHTGILYTENLYDTVQYVQDCFITIDWSSEEINTLQKRIGEWKRFKYLEERLREKATDAKTPDATIEFLIDSIRNFDCSEDDPYIPTVVDYRSTLERFKFIRKAIFSFFILDLSQIIYFDVSKAIRPEKGTSNYYHELSTLGIIVKLAKHSFTTLMKNSYHDEILAWYNMLIIVEFWNSLLFDNPSKNLKNTMINIEKYLKEIGYFKGVNEITANSIH